MTVTISYKAEKINIGSEDLLGSSVFRLSMQMSFSVFIIHCFCESQVSLIFLFVGVHYLEFLTSNQTSGAAQRQMVCSLLLPRAPPLTLLQLPWPPCSPHTLQAHPHLRPCAHLDLSFPRCHEFGLWWASAYVFPQWSLPHCPVWKSILFLFLLCFILII